ncbi:hypothetical protein ATCC90586_009830 [Pythium insidiosum]|nr:hypothetical protein ATCC90586_009830 [Pythium insidiosum]
MNDHRHSFTGAQPPRSPAPSAPPSDDSFQYPPAAPSGAYPRMPPQSYAQQTPSPTPMAGALGGPIPVSIAHSPVANVPAPAYHPMQQQQQQSPYGAMPSPANSGYPPTQPSLSPSPSPYGGTPASPSPAPRHPSLHGGIGPVTPFTGPRVAPLMPMGPSGGGVPPAPATPSSVLELRFRCKNLKTADLLSESDPFIVVYLEEGQGRWREIGRTETVTNCANPTFTKSLELDYFFEEVQRLRLEVFDRDDASEALAKHDFLGCVELTVAQLMSAQGQSMTLALLQSSARHTSGIQGHVTIFAEEVSSCADVVSLQFAADNVDNKDGWFGKSDPFLDIYRLRDEHADPAQRASWLHVWRSPTIMNNLSPRWPRVSLPVQKLCNGDLSRRLKLECVDWEASGAHQFIGSCVVTARELVAGEARSMELINAERQRRKGKRYKNSGVLRVEHVEMFKQHTFAEFLRGGCEISLIVGIDYTASNGAPSDPRSLHYLGSGYYGQQNEYQAAIAATGAVLEPYDHDRRFPVYGFGGLVNGAVNHCFPLTFDPSQPEVDGVQGILQAYAQSFPFVQLHGPTCFAPLVRQAATIAQHFSQPPAALKYFVLLILTDGAIMDMDATVEEIVAASFLPLSIVIVGVGSADFTAMNALDADGKLLRARSGRTAARDIVQFVPFNEYRSQPARLAKETLAEIPMQLTQHFQARGIKPSAPLQRANTEAFAAPAPPGARAARSQTASRENAASERAMADVRTPTATDDLSPTMVELSTPGSRKSSIFNMPNVSAGKRPDVPGVAGKTIVAGAEAASHDKAALRGNLLALFLVLTYIAASILFYHFVEGWSVVDCVYYAMVIVTTVGYGDVIPVKQAGKIFTIFFAFYGIATIGMALGRLASWFLSRQEAIAKQTTKRMLHSVDHAAATSKTADPAALKEDHAVSVQSRKRRPKWVRVLFSESNKAIAASLVPIFVSIGCGLIVGAIEGWPVLDCFYYAIITVTTVGFGDLSPKSEAARIYAIFYLPLSVVSVAHAIGSIIEEIGRRRVMKSKISMKELLAMDSDGDGKVSKLEYLSYMLVKLGKADQDDIDGILAQFNKLDKDGSGELDKEDLERLDRQLQRNHEEAHTD